MPIPPRRASRPVFERLRGRWALHWHVGVLFLVLVGAVGALLAGIGYRLTSRLLDASATDLVQRGSRGALREMQHLFAPADALLGLVALLPVVQARGLPDRLEQLPLLRQALDSAPALSALYVARADGDFFALGRVLPDGPATGLLPPPGAAYLVQSIERSDGPPRGRWLYLDAAGRTLREDDRPDHAAAYDARGQRWYGQAQAAGGPIRTPPYLFFSNRQLGSTLARPADGGRAVVGADIRLHTLGQTLATERLTPASQMLLVNGQGQVLADADAARRGGAAAPGAGATLPTLDGLGSPVLAALMSPLQKGGVDAVRTLRLRDGDERWRASVTPLRLDGVPPLFLLTATPERELHAAALQGLRHSALATLAVLLLALPLAWALAHVVARPLRRLAAAAESIRHFELAQPIKVDSTVREVAELADTLGAMKSTLWRFLDLSGQMASEPDLDHLLPRLLNDTLDAAAARSGVLYLAEDGRLRPAAALDRAGPAEAALPPAVDRAQPGPLLAAALASGRAQAAPLSAADRQALGLADAVARPHAIALPLRNRQGELVGAMLLLADAPTDAGRLSFVQALSASAALSLESRALIQAQKALFESFIRMIAAAIDAKSPYTGGHCARVPELAKALARAAHDATDGPYRDFRLGADDWEALHLAAWLHDCGKVTTPEYVVDKATKLETLHDRIHEVRMRFEVLKRDARIACLEAIAAGTDPAAAKARQAAEWQQLDDDFAFVAACNQGGEFMAPERLQRLHAIAARTWLRTLDDRLGLSHEELARKQRVPAQPLPVAEPLLADKPEHELPRRPQDRIADDNPWGLRMDVPALQYHRGELHNLSVARGTLSAEERYKINEHMVQTVIMLAQLPFPRHLRQVPEIAGGHHETMDGQGYPRRLTREQMSPLARMMAIADIFEALTAVDRPYKPGKTLSQAVAIMAGMCRARHIDAELFTLFLHAGVHLDYAKRFMQPAQIDAVDVGTICAGLAPAAA